MCMNVTPSLTVSPVGITGDVIDWLMVAGLEPARDIRAHRAFPPRCMFGLSIYQLIYTITTAPVYYTLPRFMTPGLLVQGSRLRAGRADACVMAPVFPGCHRVFLTMLHGWCTRLIRASAVRLLHPASRCAGSRVGACTLQPSSQRAGRNPCDTARTVCRLDGPRLSARHSYFLFCWRGADFPHRR